MSEVKSIVFGGNELERLEINVLGYERAASGDDHDDNWLSAKVCIHCGGFVGKFAAMFLTTELQSFHAQLDSLYQTLSGIARFDTLEGQLELEASGDGLGNIRIVGAAMDQAGIGNNLTFQIGIDQTQLQSSIRSLAAAMSAFPIRSQGTSHGSPVLPPTGLRHASWKRRFASH